MTSTELAALAGFNKSYINKLCRKGELPAEKDDAGRWIIKDTDARAFLGLVVSDSDPQPVHIPCESVMGSSNYEWIFRALDRMPESARKEAAYALLMEWPEVPAEVRTLIDLYA